MHRDIKGSNILLTKEGIIKIADLGLARDFKRINNPHFTYRVVTRWYRAPELLLAISTYNETIDVWSIGCFLAEMFIGKPIFMSKSESDQLPLIFEKLGVPHQNGNDDWPKCPKNKYYEEAFKIYK